MSRTPEKAPDFTVAEDVPAAPPLRVDRVTTSPSSAEVVPETDTEVLVVLATVGLLEHLERGAGDVDGVDASAGAGDPTPSC